MKHDIDRKKAGVVVLMTIMIIAVTGLSGCTEITGETGGDVDSTVTCSFTMTPVISASDGVLSADKTSVQIPFRLNYTAHTVTEGDNSSWVDPVITFTLKPKCGAGATKDDLASVNYEITNYNQKVNADTGDHYILTKSSNVWQGIWTGDGTQYIEGYSTLDPTQNLTLTLTLDIDQTGLSYTQNTMDAQKLSVKFYNNAWSETFDVKFTCTERYST